jgi:transposase
MEILEALDDNIDIFYFDESGFSLETLLPYAWQEFKTRLSIPKSKSKRVNVSGFLSSDGQQLFSQITIGTVASKETVDIFNNFVSQIKKKTFVVLDNASIHTSQLFSEQIDRWKQLGLELLYLPSYSPELNKIELLWKSIKERWLTPSSYTSFKKLKSDLEHILASQLCTINCT